MKHSIQNLVSREGRHSHSATGADLLARIAPAYRRGDKPEVKEIFSTIEEDSPGGVVEAILSVYQQFFHNEEEARAVEFILYCAQEFDLTADHILEIIQTSEQILSDWLKANITIIYLNKGGVSVAVFDKAFHYLLAQGAQESVVKTYRLAAAAGVQEALSEISLLNVATTMTALGALQEAFEIYQQVLPTSTRKHEILMNISTLARLHALPQAVTFFAQATNTMLDGYSAKRAAVADSVEIRYLGPESDAAMVNSVLTEGFCVVRQGCDPALIQRALDHVASGKLNRPFPTWFDDEILDCVRQMFRFDAKRVIREILKYSSQLDLRCSAVRRVRPGMPQSFTPFHQDVTAFFKAVVNIWAPLTPAGGEYPTIDFIRKRIGRAEQTKFAEGEYNLIEIDEAYVLQKYGHLLYRLESAAPGDCVIFLGSTIHRSSNIEQATKDRFNLEIRYS